MANWPTTSTCLTAAEPEGWVAPPFSAEAGRKLDSTSEGYRPASDAVSKVTATIAAPRRGSPK